MAESFFTALSAAAAWWMALWYIRMEQKAALFDTGLIAAVCGLGAFCLRSVGLAALVPLGALLFFLFVTFAVSLQQHGSHGDAVLAFLLAQGGYSLLDTGESALYHSGGRAGFLLACAAPAAFLFLTARLCPQFPASDWRDYYTEPASEQGRIRLKLAHNYLIAAALCAAMTAGRLLAAPEDLWEALFWCGAGLGAYWAAVLLLALMNAYKRERIAVLVEQQYREEMQCFLKVIRSQRHDFNFHVQTIAGLVREGKTEECRRYVAALEEDVSRMNAVLPIRDPAISAMIHNFQALAAREGIQLRLDIETDLAQIATSVYETNKIISNLLQNAIDETMTHRDKSHGIDLTILKRGEYCVIRVSNGLGDRVLAPEELGRLYQQGYTTKQGHEGVGLCSIRLLAERYHGTVYTQLEDNVISFVAKIPINYAKEAAREGSA